MPIAPRPCRPPLATRRALLAAVAGALASAAARAGDTPAVAPLEEVPYVKTPEGVVDAILTLADVRQGDRLIDLGSGDGRIVIAAAQRYGIRALGVEIDPSLVQLSNERARAAGVAERARFAVQDLFDTDLGGATVITMYLLPDVNLALRPRLLALAPGTRIVSHDWDMGDWIPDRSVEVDAPDKPVGLARRSKVHRWTVPARVAGRWRGTIDAAGGTLPLELPLAQRFQQLALGDAWNAGADAGRVDGIRLRVAVRLDGRDLVLEGTVDGDRIAGTTRIDGRETVWRAQRVR